MRQRNPSGWVKYLIIGCALFWCGCQPPAEETVATPPSETGAAPAITSTDADDVSTPVESVDSTQADLAANFRSATNSGNNQPDSNEPSDSALAGTETSGRVDEAETAGADAADTVRPPDAGANRGRREAARIAGVSIGETIRSISGNDVDGVEFAMSDYEGKVMMVDFWGDW